MNCQREYPYDLVLTDKYYCCPENSQIAFSHGVRLLDRNDVITIENSNCGNMTLRLRGVCANSPIEKSYSPPFHYIIHTALAIGNIYEVLNYLHIRLAILNSFKGDYFGRLKYEVNYTYYDPTEGEFKKVEEEIHYAEITLKDCECDGDSIEIYGDVSCSWFSNWDLYSCDVYITGAKCNKLLCKGFVAGHLFRGTPLEDAPGQGTTTKKEIYFCPNIISIEEFQVTSVSGNPVKYTFTLTESPPRGYEV